MNKLSEVVFTLNDTEWDVLGLAEGWQESHELDWLDITGNDDEFSFLLLDEGGNVVQTEFEVDWFWTDMISLVSASSGLSLGLESLLLLLGSFWRVLAKELNELGLLVLLNGVGEDVKNWWALKSHEKNSLLSLDSDILWPFHVSSQVSGWLNVSTNSEVSWGLLEERSRSS